MLFLLVGHVLQDFLRDQHVQFAVGYRVEHFALQGPVEVEAEGGEVVDRDADELAHQVGAPLEFEDLDQLQVEDLQLPRREIYQLLAHQGPYRRVRVLVVQQLHDEVYRDLFVVQLLDQVPELLRLAAGLERDRVEDRRKHLRVLDDVVP